MPRSHPLEHAATDWFLRAQQPGWSPADQQALNDWLRADPRHGQAYRHAAHTWGLLAELPRPALAIAPAHAPPHAPSRRHAMRRAGPAFALGLAALAGVGWWSRPATPQHEASLRTDALAPRSLDLPDGSSIALNRDGALDLRYFADRREVRLLRGEAFFEVAKDAQRPFTVFHGDAQVRVLGTAFNLRAEGDDLMVKVRSGRVEVRADGHSRAHVLEPGQAVAVDGRTRALHDQVLAADTVGSWRHGQLVFRDTPLAEVARELSRYRAQPVTVADAALARERISGYASTAAPDAFVRALPQMLALRVQPQPDGSIALQPR